MSISFPGGGQLKSKLSNLVKIRMLLYLFFIAIYETGITLWMIRQQTNHHPKLTSQTHSASHSSTPFLNSVWFAMHNNYCCESSKKNVANLCPFLKLLTISVWPVGSSWLWCLYFSRVCVQTDCVSSEFIFWNVCLLLSCTLPLHNSHSKKGFLNATYFSN